MKSAFAKLFVLATVLASAQASQARSASADLICMGNGYTVNVSYIVTITDNAQVQMKIEKNKKVIANVSTEGDEGRSVDFIHNAYTTETTADKDGNIIQYGNGVAPRKLMTFMNENASQPKLLEVDLKKATLSQDGIVVANLTCQEK